MKTADKARLIRHALSSNHFQGFWPGADTKRANSAATSGSGGWGGPSGWGQLTKNGIETLPIARRPARRDQRRVHPLARDPRHHPAGGDQARPQPPRECLPIRRGLKPENRERYEAASAAHLEQSRTPLRRASVSDRDRPRPHRRVMGRAPHRYRPHPSSLRCRCGPLGRPGGSPHHPATTALLPGQSTVEPLIRYSR